MQVPLTQFLQLQRPILDVRSPSEYAKAHIPGALNHPLFSDEERARVGTCYKQVGPREALLMGMDIVGPRLRKFILKTEELALGQEAAVYCWRGGMRSGFVSQLLNLGGIKTACLKGGYKAYRNHIHSLIEMPWKLHIVGGLTGAGKTEILHALKDQKEQTVDLEGLAEHRGSTYGGLGQGPQPSTEHFENLIGDILKDFDPKEPLWIEGESRLVGSCRVPDPLFVAMQKSQTFLVERSKEERLEQLRGDYTGSPIEALLKATNKLKKRLGGERCQKACQLIEAGSFEKAGRMILEYYDTSYQHSLARSKAPIAFQLDATGLSPKEAAKALIANMSASSLS